LRIIDYKMLLKNKLT